MEHKNIWEYYQTEMPEIFATTMARQRHMFSLLPKGSKVLNIGAGTGLLEAICIENGVDIYSLDPGEASIAALRDRLSMGDKAVVGFSQKMPFSDGMFGAVVATEVFEHLDSETFTQTLQEIDRVLAKDGLLIGTVPANEVLAEQQAVCPHCACTFHRWGHLQSFDMPGLQRTLSTHFNILKIYARKLVNYATLSWKGKTIEFLKSVLNRLGSHGSGECIVFVVQKKVK